MVYNRVRGQAVAGFEGTTENRWVLTCDECSRPAMTFDPEKELVRVESRHGGERHVTVLTFRQLIAQVSALAVKA